MLVINPDECIDCGVCEPECPEDAIKSESDVSDADKWIEINRKYSEEWPNITEKKDSLPEAEKFSGIKEKFEQYFSPAPGEGD